MTPTQREYQRALKEDAMRDLRLLRESLGMSMHDAAKAVGMAHSAYQYAEWGVYGSTERTLKLLREWATHNAGPVQFTHRSADGFIRSRVILAEETVEFQQGAGI